MQDIAHTAKASYTNKAYLNIDEHDSNKTEVGYFEHTNHVYIGVLF